MPTLTAPNNTYNSVTQGGSQGSVNGYGLTQGPSNGFPTGTGAVATAGEKGNKANGIAGAAVAGFNGLLEMAAPFIQDAQNKKAQKKMDAGFASKGLLNDKEFGKYAQTTASTIESLDSAKFGSLYGGMENGGETKKTTAMKGLLYKKNGKGDTLKAKSKSVKELPTKGAKMSPVETEADEEKRRRKAAEKAGRKYIPGPKGGF